MQITKDKVSNVAANKLKTGMICTAITFIAAMVTWPIWGIIAKQMCNILAGSILVQEPELSVKYISVVAEGGFFVLVINPWIWQVLVLGNYQKNWFKPIQPVKGIMSLMTGALLGMMVFSIITGFLGIWWEIFNLRILFMPRTSAELHLAIEGWELIDYYTLSVLIVQIPSVSLFHKWPFGGKVAAPYDGIAAMAAGTAIALLVWFGTVIPSLVPVDVAHIAIKQPLGNWPAYLAFAQAFIWWCLIPQEGGEHYPMKLFATKQPYMGIVGLIIALIGGFITPMMLRPLLEMIDLPETMNIDVAIASFIVSIILFTLIWHHLFDDYPDCDNVAKRVIIRILIWITGGSIWGVLWIKVLFPMLPFGGNDLGLGYPSPGLIAGQFCIVLCALIINTYFEKWPIKP